MASKFLTPEQQDRFGIHKLDPVDAVETSATALLEAPKADKPASTLASDPSSTFKAQSDAPSCHYCGSIMVRNGACYRCANCGSTSGCS
jgi:ribonucleoside-diphosphate reductase alpha chain